MSIELTSPAAVLALPLAHPERVFSGDPAALQKEWRTLAAQWHPDRHGGSADAQRAFQHLGALRDEAEARIAAGLWAAPNEIEFTAIDGRQYRLRDVRVRAFELGETYIGRSTLAYAVSKTGRDLFEAATARIAALGFASDAMRRQFSAGLPQVVATFETASRLVLVLRRDPDFVALSDLLAHLGGRLEPVHLAWVIGGLENLACYLAQQGLVHGAIGPGTVFVAPRTHQVALLGGWWYATRAGATLTALPGHAMRVLPPMILDGGRSAPAIDLELIRALGREALGDPAGSRILHDGSVPRPFARWLTHAPAATAYADYANWETVRDASFGKRRFVELKVSPEHIHTTPQPLGTGV